MDKFIYGGSIVIPENKEHKMIYENIIKSLQ